MTTYSHAKPAGTPTWIDLVTPDPEAARSFYRAIFGWEYDISGPEFGNYAMGRLGQQMTAGISGPPPGAPPMPATWNLYFASDDAAADAGRAQKLGGTVLVPAMPIGEFGTFATVADPGGASFGLWQAGQHIGATLTDEPGSMAWNELYATDAKVSRDFYTALLGATADPMPGDMEYYTLMHGETALAGVMKIEPSWGNFRPQWMTYFAVANADETLRLITRNGGKAMSRVDDSPFGRLAAAADPAGALFKIVQLPAR